MTLPIIALLGRPNVGKSTVFNRLTRSRDALVADFPGLTRDRRYGTGRLGAGDYVLVDTGGVSGNAESVDKLVEHQALYAAQEADVTILITDGRAGLTAADEELAAKLRRLGCQALVAVNKTENLNSEQACADFYALGLGDPVAVSATHGHGLELLTERFLNASSPRPEPGLPVPDSVPAAAAETVSLAVVGKPNVGKSTLVNRLLGEERMLASDQPGTTRDSISVPFTWRGGRYTLIDTAGVRRRSRVHQAVEKFSIVKTLQAIEAANVVLLMVDARAAVSEQDASLLGYVAERGRALVIAVNKWDHLASEQRQATRQSLAKRFAFVDYADVHYISARHGTGIADVMCSAQNAFHAAYRTLGTAELTRVLEDAIGAHQPPLVGGRRIKLRYAHQGGRNPPVVVIHGSRTEKLPQSYRRYLIGKYREVFGLHGTPVRLALRSGVNPYVPDARSGQRGRG